MAKKTKSPPPATKQTAKSIAPAKVAPVKSDSVKQADPVKAVVAQSTAPVASPPVAAAPVKPAPATTKAERTSPTALIETLAAQRQDSLNNAIAQLHALHSQMLQAAGRHANTALQFINSAPKSGTLTDLIEWQSRWFLSHAHVHQDGVKALSTLASKNMEHLQKSLRVDLPRKAS